MWPTSWRCCSVRNISWQISQHSICQGLINPQSQLKEKYFLCELFLIQEAENCCHQPYWAVKRSFQGMKLSISQPGCSFDSLRRQYLLLEMLRNLGYDISSIPSHPGCASIKLFCVTSVALTFTQYVTVIYLFTWMSSPTGLKLFEDKNYVFSFSVFSRVARNKCSIDTSWNFITYSGLKYVDLVRISLISTLVFFLCLADDNIYWI